MAWILWHSSSSLDEADGIEIEVRGVLAVEGHAQRDERVGKSLHPDPQRPIP